MNNDNHEHSNPKIVLSEWIKALEEPWNAFFQNSEGSGTDASPNKAQSFENVSKEDFSHQCQAQGQKMAEHLLTFIRLNSTQVFQGKTENYSKKTMTFHEAVIKLALFFSTAFEKAFHRTFEKQKKNGNKDFGYYDLWIKELEEEFTQILGSREYASLLASVFDAAADLSNARQECLNESLKFMSIPTNKDMDGVYKEIYLLKKQVKKLTGDLEELNSHS